MNDVPSNVSVLIKPRKNGKWKVVRVYGMQDVFLFEGKYMECWHYRARYNGDRV